MTIAGTTRPPPLLLSRLERQLSPPRRRQHSPLKSSPSHRYNFDDGSPVKIGSPLLRYSPIRAAGSLAAARAASTAALLSPFRRHRRGGSPLKRVTASSPSRVLASPNRVVASPVRSIKSAQLSVYSGRQWQTCTVDLYSDGKLRYAVLAPGGGTAAVHMLHVDDDVAFVQLDDVERTFELRLKTGRKTTQPRQLQPSALGGGGGGGGLVRSGSSGYLTQGQPIRFRAGSVADLAGWVRALRSQRLSDFRPEACLHAIEESVRAEERSNAERAAVLVLATRAPPRLSNSAQQSRRISPSLCHPSRPSPAPSSVAHPPSRHACCRRRRQGEGRQGEGRSGQTARRGGARRGAAARSEMAVLMRAQLATGSSSGCCI